MHPLPLLRSLALGFSAFLLLPAGFAAEKFATSAVCSQVEKNYRRHKNADGTLKPEYYAISFGGQAEGTTTDQTIDRVKLAEFSALLQQHLAEQQYLLAPNAQSADLLLHIKWGRTDSYNTTNYGRAVDDIARSVGTMNMTTTMSGQGTQETQSSGNDAAGAVEAALVGLAMENQVRDLETEAAARLLGYLDEVNDVNDIRRLAGGGFYYDDLRADLEEPRYYIVIFAYDFRALTEKKQQKVRWITRISIRATGNQFDANLAAMVKRAGMYFGRSSAGLVRRFEGTVELGETEYLGVVEDTAPSPAAGPAPESEVPKTPKAP